MATRKRKAAPKPSTTRTSSTKTASTKTARKSSKGLTKSGPVIVGILTGSPSDLPTVNKAKAVLDELGISSEVRALSAHRTPHEVVAYIHAAEKSGVEVLIACAGMAAHLAGVVAAHTTLPVIGVPLSGGMMDGLDALLSTVQMPPGVPVATVGVNGTKNAALLAARILQGAHPEVRDRIVKRLEKDKERYELGKGAKKPSKKAKKTPKKTRKRS